MPGLAPQADRGGIVRRLRPLGSRRRWGSVPRIPNRPAAQDGGQETLRAALTARRSF